MYPLQQTDETNCYKELLSEGSVCDSVKYLAEITKLNACVRLIPKADITNFFDRSFEEASSDNLNPEVYYDLVNGLETHEYGGTCRSEFCQLLRKSPKGQYKCCQEHSINCNGSFKGHRIINHTCYAGFRKMTAAIHLGSHPIANLSLEKPPEKKESINPKELFYELGLNDHGVDVSYFESAYNKLKNMEPPNINHAEQLLYDTAEILSEKATSREMLNIIQDIGRDIAAIQDLRDILKFFINHAKRLIKFDNASIWLTSLNMSKQLEPAACSDMDDMEPDDLKRYFSKQVAIGEDLLGKVAVNRSGVLFNKRKEILEYSPEIEYSRRLKHLCSYAAAPMWAGGNLIGVFELGSNSENAFTNTDLHLLNTLAAHASVSAQSARVASVLSEIISQRDIKKLVDCVVLKVPKLINAKGCSLFLRKNSKEGRAYLVASQGIPQEYVAEDIYLKEEPKPGKAYYEPGQGLTGWVLEEGEILNIEAHNNEKHRRDEIEKFNKTLTAKGWSPLKWEGLYREQISDSGYLSNSMDEYARKAWLGVPIVYIDNEGKKNIYGVLRVTEKDPDNFSEEEGQILQACSRNVALVLHNDYTEKRNNTLLIEVVAALAAAIDAKDSYTEGHSQHVREISVGIGKRMNLNEKELKDLEMAALLHDIGKIGIPDIILSKPGEFNKAERKMIGIHPEIGAAIIEKITDFGNICRGVLEHHERMNGSGYPKGIEGENISLFGRIIAVADCFDAMTTKRPYKNEKDYIQAFEEIDRDVQKGVLDKEVVKAFREEYGTLFKAVKRI